MKLSDISHRMQSMGAAYVSKDIKKSLSFVKTELIESAFSVAVGDQLELNSLLSRSLGLSASTVLS